MKEKGFSLVELMVVVAIIGTLAVMAVPSISKYAAKARQSEAKAQLAGLFTSVKSFQAQYGIYDNQFGVVGFGPEGDMRYNVGFAAPCGGNLASAGYAIAVTPAMAPVNTSVWCGFGMGAGVGADEKCQIRLTGAAVAPPVLALTSCVPSTGFVARASGFIREVAFEDIWSIDQDKTIRQEQDGVN